MALPTIISLTDVNAIAIQTAFYIVPGAVLTFFVVVIKVVDILEESLRLTNEMLISRTRSVALRH